MVWNTNGSFDWSFLEIVTEIPGDLRSPPKGGIFKEPGLQSSESRRFLTGKKRISDDSSVLIVGEWLNNGNRSDLYSKNPCCVINLLLNYHDLLFKLIYRGEAHDTIH